ncbi:hypothetical protein H9P43_006630 [Blastocladiella emersonii ATCC 22665]|nr:hypothetical protein H9P43_006630 [Blastocladiella emersonii ATCC 22665]
MKDYHLPPAEIPLFVSLTVLGTVACVACLGVSFAEIYLLHVRAPSSNTSSRLRPSRSCTCRTFDYAPYVMSLSSIAAFSWCAANLHALAQPAFPVIRNYYPDLTTLACIQASLLASFSNLAMLKRVTSICIKRTRFHAVITPVTVTMSVAMVPVNYIIASNQIDDAARADLDWVNYELPGILLVLNAVQAVWGVACTVHAYGTAFSNTSTAASSSSRLRLGLNARLSSSVANVLRAGSTTLPRSATSSSSHTQPGAGGAAGIEEAAARRGSASHQRQHLLSSIRQTYSLLTAIYVGGWAVTLVFLGTAGAYMSIILRASVASLIFCVGILLEAQFRRIVRTRAALGSRGGRERAVMHFEDTVAGDGGGDPGRSGVGAQGSMAVVSHTSSAEKARG